VYGLHGERLKAICSRVKKPEYRTPEFENAAVSENAVRGEFAEPSNWRTLSCRVSNRNPYWMASPPCLFLFFGLVFVGAAAATPVAAELRLT